MTGPARQDQAALSADRREEAADTSGGGGNGSLTAAGQPTTKAEYYTTLEQPAMHHLTSLLCEGVFEKFPNLRKKEDWNHVQISFKGPRLQVILNGTKICDVTDNPTAPSEAAWKKAGPISFQWPHVISARDFAGFVKLRNVRIREL